MKNILIILFTEDLWKYIPKRVYWHSIEIEYLTSWNNKELLKIDIYHKWGSIIISVFSLKRTALIDAIKQLIHYNLMPGCIMRQLNNDIKNKKYFTY